MLSVIIPTNKDPYIQKTIDSLLNNALGDLEILVVLDNYLPDPPIRSDKRVKVISSPRILGRRSATNAGLAQAKGQFIMKCDSHCVFGPGYDKIMTENCSENWLVVPRRYFIDETNWTFDPKYPPVDYYYLAFPTFASGHLACLPVYDWMSKTRARKAPKYDLDDLMLFLGSCWLVNKKYYMRQVGFLNDSSSAYGPFVDEPHEIGLKYWLGGGSVKINKKTWYAHLIKWPHHYKYGQYTRYYRKNFDALHGQSWSAWHWLNNQEPGMIHPFSWLVEKFWPVPTWPEDRSRWDFSQKTFFDNKEITPYYPTQLCQLALKYRSDKCPQLGHPYTPFYSNYLSQQRRLIKKVLVVGRDDVSADLKMWADFFPQAQIFGLDIVGYRPFDNPRIITFSYNLNSRRSLTYLVSEIGSDVEVVFDNAWNHIDYPMFTFKNLMPLLFPQTTYIVENYSQVKCQRPNRFRQYNRFIPDLGPHKISGYDGLAIFTKNDSYS